MEIDRFGQIEIIKLFEMMAQGGIDFGFGGRGVENVVIADTFLFREFDRQKQERRMNAFAGSFFQVMPAEETKNEAELGESIFDAVAAGFADDFIEHAGNVGRI